MTKDQDWSIAIFAHNEEQHILRCLESLSPEAQGRPVAIYVLANGCTDKTEALVGGYAQTHSDVNLVPIRLGDKANAWNYFVHSVAPDTELVFFMDGDVEVLPGALDALSIQLAADIRANAISGLPATGRSGSRVTESEEAQRGIWGGLYCLRGTFVSRVRVMNVRIPIGLVGDDGLVGAFVKHDLGSNLTWDETLVARNTNPKARFVFSPLSPVNLNDVRLYFRRLVRYAIRGYQNRMLTRLINEEGFTGLPDSATELYKKYPDLCRLEFRGPGTFFDWLALRRMRVQAGTSAHR